MKKLTVIEKDENAFDLTQDKRGRLKSVTTQHITIYYNCIGAFSVPGRRNIPNVEIKMGTRKGVAVSYSPERIA